MYLANFLRLYILELIYLYQQVIFFLVESVSPSGFLSKKEGKIRKPIAMGGGGAIRKTKHGR
jgi:hypothetical protein